MGSIMGTSCQARYVYQQAYGHIATLVYIVLEDRLISRENVLRAIDVVDRGYFVLCGKAWLGMP